MLLKNKIKQDTYGGVAQLGEHLPCKQGVRGSNPLISTVERDFHDTYLENCIYDQKYLNSFNKRTRRDRDIEGYESNRT